jgi:hypothetical protein
MSAALTLSGLQNAQIDILPEVYTRRDVAVLEARQITSIGDAFEAESAADALRAVSTIAKEIEEARKIVKDPVLALGKKIDETAKTFVADLITEKDRLQRLLGDHQAAEQRKADKLRREAQEEADRLAREAATAARAAERATTDGQAEQAQQAAAVAEVKAIEARVAVADIKREGPKGFVLNQPYKFEVTDINALFKARPDLCVIEPNGAAIRAQIPHNQNIPGLRIWQEAKARVR